MSASTVSIRANPAARRRPVLSTKTAATNVELIGVDTATTNATQNNQRVGINGDGGDTRVTSISGRDLRPSLDPVQAREALVNGPVSPRRARKAAARPVKPLWRTVVSVFVKNFVLLVVLLGLVQLIYRLAVKAGGGTGVGVGDGTGVGMEFEGRLAEMEKVWKKTTKMMQVQVEVLDKKLRNEVVKLREEIGNRIEERSVVLDNEMHKLDAKFENMESAVGKLSLDDFLTKEQFQKFYQELKNVGSGGNDEISLDEVRAYAREVVEKEIEKHAADGLGMVDYALATGGAMVVRHSEPFVLKGSWLARGVGRNAVHKDAEKMLRPSFGEPGQCFPFKGSSGFVQIRLRTAIIPEAITLEHVAKSVAYDRSSAPKDCRVSGWKEPALDSLVKTEKMLLLSEFTYDLDKSSAQTFPVSDAPGVGAVDMIRLDFVTNHGSPSHTCVYRLRVHGREPKSIPSLQELHS